jgi:hypothetical protein
MPQETTASHSKARETLQATGNHGKPRQATASHCKPRETTASHGKPRQATASHHGKPRHGKPRQTMAGHGKPRETTTSHGKPSHGKPRQTTASHGKPRPVGGKGRPFCTSGHLNCHFQLGSCPGVACGFGCWLWLLALAAGFALRPPRPSTTTQGAPFFLRTIFFQLQSLATSSTIKDHSLHGRSRKKNSANPDCLTTHSSAMDSPTRLILGL